MTFSKRKNADRVTDGKTAVVTISKGALLESKTWSFGL